MQEIKDIIESLLFVAEEPLTVDKLRSILETAETKEIHNTLQSLAEEYDQRGGGFMLRQVAGGWQIRSRPEYNEWIKRMLQPSPQRLSRAALETLAVVAYKQPIIRADIEHIRGVDCGGVLRQLMERKIIRVLGRKEIAGRPLIYATTKLFLEMFDLKDLHDLPTPKEIAELGNTMLDSQQEDTAPPPAPEQQALPQQEDSNMESLSEEAPDTATEHLQPEDPAQATDPAPVPLDRQETAAPLPVPAESEKEQDTQEPETTVQNKDTEEAEVVPDPIDPDHEDTEEQPSEEEDASPSEKASVIMKTGHENSATQDPRDDLKDDDAGNDSFDDKSKNA